MLEVAERIGARLCRDALRSRGRCNWTSDYLDEQDKLAHGALGPYLYSGTSGIALFLSRLARVTGESIFQITAEGALRQALGATATGCGFYSGALGIQWAASEIREEVDVDASVQYAAPEGAELDVIGGSAGAIGALLALHARARMPRLLELAVEHGDLLLSAASRTENGWSWKTIPAKCNVTGFSHGTAGIGWALLELYRATKEDRFRAAALEAFRYERSCFSATEQNWPDFREEQTTYPAYWCHGAVGIGFSRLRAWQILGDEEMLREARIALEKARQQLDNFSLCHGEAGNADLLLYASEVLGTGELLEAARATARQGNDRFEQKRIPWPCGLPDANETPGLMLGLAGIGYFFLRTADPVRTPTVLIPFR